MRTNISVKHHPDCHVVFDHAFYSAPHRLIGQKLWVRSADTSVWIFYQHELVASHPRAIRRDKRRTNPDHLRTAIVAAASGASVFSYSEKECGPSSIARYVGGLGTYVAKSLEISPILKPKTALETKGTGTARKLDSATRFFAAICGGGEGGIRTTAAC